MAQLTNLESKLGEVVGLAMAAQDAGQKVTKLAKDDGNDDLVRQLERMRDEAKETEERGTEVAAAAGEQHGDGGEECSPTTRSRSDPPRTRAPGRPCAPCRDGASGSAGPSRRARRPHLCGRAR